MYPGITRLALPAAPYVQERSTGDNVVVGHSDSGLIDDKARAPAGHVLLETDLGIYEKALGTDHPAIATSLENLGFLLEAQGDYAGAQPYLERALAIHEKVPGPDHPDTRTVRSNLADLDLSSSS